MWILSTKKEKTGSLIFISTITIILFALSVMVQRILVVSAPFAAIALCALIPESKSRQHLGRAGLVVALAVNLVGINLMAPPADRFLPHSFQELFGWINSNTKPTDSIAARISIGPMILINTGRPQVLHPKFENLAIRNRYREFTEALYGTDEDRMVEFCKRYKVDYLVYDWSFFISDDKDSVRYLGNQYKSISKDILASRLHFSDGGLKHFIPKYRNTTFIVYKFSDDINGDEAVNFHYSPVYDADLFMASGGSYKDTRSIYDNLILPFAATVNHAVILLGNKKPHSALKILEPAVARVPKASRGVYLLSIAYVENGRYEDAKRVIGGYLQLMKNKDIMLEPAGSNILDLYRQLSAAQ